MQRTTINDLFIETSYTPDGEIARKEKIQHWSTIIKSLRWFYGRLYEPWDAVSIQLRSNTGDKIEDVQDYEKRLKQDRST